jgi:integrase
MRRCAAGWRAAAAETLGDLVFPAMTNGRAMHAASVYRRIEILLEEAGVLAGRSERASPQTLRNTCGAMHFDAGTPPAAVAQLLGMRDMESGWRLRAAYEAWQARTGLPVMGRPLAPERWKRRMIHIAAVMTHGYDGSPLGERAT